MIEASQTKVEAGSALAERAGGSTMADIVASIRRVTDIMGEIAAASKEQSTGIHEVNKAVTLMDEATQQNAALARGPPPRPPRWRSRARSLDGAIAVFRLH